MTFRVYLRWPKQRISDKTVTESRDVAELAFKALVARVELAGQPVGAAFTEDGKQLAFHRFDEVGGDARGPSPGPRGESSEA